MTRGKRLLMLDDDQRLAASFKRYFDLKGEWEFAALSDPALLYGRLEEFDPDVLVLDLDLGRGEKDGFEVLRLLRRRQKYRELPVLILTGTRKRSEQVAEGFQSGADEYVVKPVSPKALEARAWALLRLVRRTAGMRTAGS